MKRYLCYYRSVILDGKPIDFTTEIRTVFDNPEVPGLERIGAFIEGFFLNGKMDLVERGDPDICYWIPPSAIVTIEIVDIEQPVDPEFCKHGERLTDYCEPCGRVNGGST